MDAALETHLGGSAVDGFEHPALDLLVVEEIGRAPQVERQRSLRERAEPALERAHVRVVDVPVADERDRVADGVGSQLIGDHRDFDEVGAARSEEGDDLVDADGLTCHHAVEHLADRGTGAGRPPGYRRARKERRRCRFAPRGPRVVARQALEVGGATHREPDVVVQPPVAVADVLGIDGEARRERLAGGLGRFAQHVEPGPWPLGVHVVGRDRGDPAPVVDAGRDQRREISRLGEVRGCLEVDRRVEDEAGGGDGPEELLGVARGRAPHRRARLGEEVLDDHLLDVAVAGVGAFDGHEGLEPFAAVLADAHQDPGGERHLRPSRRLQRGEAPRRGLVGGTGVGTARLGQPVGERLDHHPLRR